MESKIQKHKAYVKVKLTINNAKREIWSKTWPKLDLRRKGNRAWNVGNNLAGKQRGQTQDMLRMGRIQWSRTRKGQDISTDTLPVLTGRAAECTNLDKKKTFLTVETQNNPTMLTTRYMKRTSLYKNYKRHWGNSSSTSLLGLIRSINKCCLT